MNSKHHKILRRAILIGATVLLLVAGGYYTERNLWDEKYHQQSPQKIFQEVMGRPVPAGISDLRVAGRGFLTKRWVRMRFQATDKAITTLIGSAQAYDQLAAQDAMQRQSYAAKPKYEEEDRKALDWQQVFSIRKLEVYQISRGQAGQNFIWIGDIIVDRKNRTIYLQAAGD